MRKRGPAKQFAGRHEVMFTQEQFDYLDREALRRSVPLAQIIREAVQAQMDKENSK